MTVRELIERLQQVDPEQDVRIDAAGAEEQWQRFYEITAVEICISEDGQERVCLV
jgi:hypothetical protein